MPGILRREGRRYFFQRLAQPYVGWVFVEKPVPRLAQAYGRDVERQAHHCNPLVMPDDALSETFGNAGRHIAVENKTDKPEKTVKTHGNRSFAAMPAEKFAERLFKHVVALSCRNVLNVWSLKELFRRHAGPDVRVLIAGKAYVPVVKEFFLDDAADGSG